MNIYAIYTLFQAGKFLPCIVGLVVVLSVFLWIVTSKCISAPIVILATSEGRILDKETCYIHRIIYCSIFIVALSLLLLALLDSLFCTFNGSVQLFERAAGVVVNCNLVGNVGSNLFGLVQNLFKLHGSIVDVYGSIEIIEREAAALYGCQPIVVD